MQVAPRQQLSIRLQPARATGHADGRCGILLTRVTRGRNLLLAHRGWSALPNRQVDLAEAVPNFVFIDFARRY